jgi:nitrous oxidase accessory protein
VTSIRAIRVGTAVAAAGLVAWSSQLPLWQMTMRAPQYPKGLRLYAFGTRMQGDLSELNILNHYIGMPAIQAPTLETSLFPIGIGLLVGLCLAAPAHSWVRRAAAATAALMPIGILADLQWRLYEFGHALNPTAPIRLKPFTPLVIGQTQMGNFVSTAMISWGVVCLLGAALLLWAGGRSPRQKAGRRVPDPRRAAAIAAMLVLTIVSPATQASAPSGLLQARIDATPRGGTLVVPAGIHAGPILIRGPLTVVAEPGAIVDGGGSGSVVTIGGDDVVFRGFTVRNSGREVTQEAAGITVTGSRHRVEANHVLDVYFGVHAGAGNRVAIRDNTITPGMSHGARPGHGISVWNMDDAQILGNRISDARDGIYLSFTNRVNVTGNVVTRSRYGLHSMYSRDARFEDNDAAGNLLGAALMMSDRLVLRRNRISQHREGPAAYGLLLKDIGDLVAEDNEILANRVGVYAEGVPASPAKEAILRGNVIAGNEVGLALQSNAALTMTGNRIAENLTDVRPLGRQLSAGMRWTREGRGNSWGQYRGFDADRDGIGDVPHTLEDAMDALVRRNSLIQAFLYTPAHLALESAARMFPLFRQAPVLTDDRPLMAIPSTHFVRSGQGR